MIHRDESERILPGGLDDDRAATRGHPARATVVTRRIQPEDRRRAPMRGWHVESATTQLGAADVRWRCQHVKQRPIAPRS
jgi:hypothetical protein